MHINELYDQRMVRPEILVKRSWCRQWKSAAVDAPLPLSGVTEGSFSTASPVGRVKGWAEVVSEYPRIYVDASGEMWEILSTGTIPARDCHLKGLWFASSGEAMHMLLGPWTVALSEPFCPACRGPGQLLEFRRVWVLEGSGAFWCQRFRW